MHRLIYLILLAILPFSSHLFAQNKFEKESRIKEKDAPIKATEFINSLNLDVKIKWIKEEGLNGKSFEAKFKHNKRKYSIEFDSQGNIEDVEIETELKDIDPKIIDTISAQLKQECVKYRIVKAQVQLIGDKNELSSLIKTGAITVTSENVLLKYEIVVICKQQNAVDLYECLFNDVGKLESKLKIVFKNSSHLEY